MKIKWLKHRLDSESVWIEKYPRGFLLFGHIMVITQASDRRKD